MKNPNILARLFGRASQNPVVAQLYTSVIGQPLLVHAQMGEQLIGGYLHGAIDARPPTSTVLEIAPARQEAGGVTTNARNIAILNVSGALANRYAGDLCDPGPLSYQELRTAFDVALANDSVEAIVLRIESPGGMAAGVFDLTDHIHASRGTKPIYAAVDDYAYSGGYAIASAADEVWVTRTGGVGSVGVISYHVDQSGYDAKIGVKVTALYSGERKNDLNPHFELSEEARAWLQERMDATRTLFASSVAKYRGMEFDSVLGTEAQVYQGQAGIDAGFADKLGTFHDLIEHIRGGLADEVESQAAQPHQDGNAASDAGRVAYVTAISESPLPAELRLALITREQTEGDSAAAIEYASKLRDLAFAAGDESLAIEFVKQNTPIEVARAQMIALKATDGPEVVTSLPHAHDSAGGSCRSLSSYEDIRNRRRAAAAGSR